MTQILINTMNLEELSLTGLELFALILDIGLAYEAAADSVQKSFIIRYLCFLVATVSTLIIMKLRNKLKKNLFIGIAVLHVPSLIRVIFCQYFENIICTCLFYACLSISLIFSIEYFWKLCKAFNKGLTRSLQIKLEEENIRQINFQWFNPLRFSFSLLIYCNLIFQRGKYLFYMLIQFLAKQEQSPEGALQMLQCPLKIELYLSGMCQIEVIKKKNLYIGTLYAIFVLGLIFILMIFGLSVKESGLISLHQENFTESLICLPLNSISDLGISQQSKQADQPYTSIWNDALFLILSSPVFIMSLLCIWKMTQMSVIGIFNGLELIDIEVPFLGVCEENLTILIYIELFFQKRNSKFSGCLLTYFNILRKSSKKTY